MGDGVGDELGDGWVTGWVTEYDEQVIRGEELGDKVRGAGTRHAAHWVWHTCSSVLNDHNTWCWQDTFPAIT